MDNTQQLSQKLLFMCTRLDSADVDAHQLQQLLPKIIDWQNVLNILEENGLAPLFYSHLTHHSLFIDSNVSLALKALVLRHQSVSQARYQAVHELHQALVNASIPWIALKGLALASSLYPEVGQRPMRDMDILVPKKDLSRVADIMRSLGYTLPKEQPSRYMKGTHQLPNAEKIINGFTISIEIHHNAISQDAYDSLQFEDVDGLAEAVQWDDLSIPILPNELMLHQLCRHLEALHPGGNLKLINVIDVVSFVEKNIANLNWQLIFKQYSHVLNTLHCLNYIIPLSPELRRVINIQHQPILREVGQIMLPLSIIFNSRSSKLEKLRKLFLPPDWWLHLYYGVNPRYSLIFVKCIRHPLRLGLWLFNRLISRLLGSH